MPRDQGGLRSFAAVALCTLPLAACGELEDESIELVASGIEDAALTIGQADVVLASYEYGTDTCGVTACYDVTGRTRPEVSHFIVGTPGGCDDHVGVVTLDGVPVAASPADYAQKGCAPIHGIKLDLAIRYGETREVCITYDRPFPLDEVAFQVKAGKGCATGSVPGPLCVDDERCDGIDNDCDGATDEGFAIGETCSAGVGECERDGALVCTAEGSGTVCDAIPGEPGVELCGSGLDENCDGSVDEGFDDGDACDNGQLGECAREGVKVCSDDLLSTVCDAPYVEPGIELCGTGLDESCDGSVDEGFDDGDACANGQLGVCARDGVKVCSDDLLSTVCDAPYVEPGVELCGTGLDENCDGSVDEGYDDGSACDNGQLGECARDGVKVCSADLLSTVCNAPSVEPGVELCGTGLDENCDGSVDEGYDDGSACDNGQLGECARDGVKVCAADLLSTVCTAPNVEPGVELCGTGLDESCDGNVDEGYNDGDPCSAGVGACNNDGQYVCSDDRLSTWCDAVPGEGSDEQCNGIDDDCDGEVDEGMSEAELGGEDPVVIGQGTIELLSYTLDAESNTTTACYLVSSAPSPTISHFVEGTVGTCDSALLEVTLDGQPLGITPGDYAHEACDQAVHGVKIEQGGVSSSDPRELCLVYDGLREQNLVPFQVKAGTLCETGEVVGVSCELTELCPSFD